MPKHKDWRAPMQNHIPLISDDVITSELVIIGAGGYATKRGTRHEGYIVQGTIEEMERDFQGRALWFFSAIGDNQSRANVARRAEDLGWRPATLIHPTAILSGNVEVGVGSYVGQFSVVSVNTKIGAHAVIDMHVSIGHDAVIKDFCSVYPGARISGCCCLGEYALVGSNATLLPGTAVGDRAVVGASSLGSGTIEPGATILGVPGRIIYRKSSFCRQ